MNRLEHQLPPWASEDTRQSLARDFAVWVGRELLVDDGAGGWDWSRNAQLRAHASPIVAEVATALPRERMWSARGVAQAVCKALDLHGAEYAVAERLRDRNSPVSEFAKVG